MSTFDGFSYIDSAVQIRASDPVIVMVSPPTEEAFTWGFYQFPKVWRAPEGERLYLRVNVGQDMYGGIGLQKSPRYCASADAGQTWRQISSKEVVAPQDIIAIPGGGDLRIRGEGRGITPKTEGGDTEVCTEKISLNGLSPTVERMTPNGHGVIGFYRCGDIPEECRTFSFEKRKPGECDWTIEKGLVDFPELLLGSAGGTVVKSRLSLESNWQAVEPELTVPKPSQVVVSEDGTLFSMIAGQQENNDRYFSALHCLASTDCGKTWEPRGVIADQPELSTWGYSGFDENVLIIEPNGDLVCAIRTDSCRACGEDTMETLISRSTDTGYSWSKPQPVAPYSVTPHLIQLTNGITVLVYGRPGVHFLSSTDYCRTWHTPYRVIGTHTKEDLKTEAKRRGVPVYPLYLEHDTCANTSFVKTGDNSFLLAYSDFEFRNGDGERCKAIVVQEFSVNSPAAGK